MILLNKLETFLVNGGVMECYCVLNEENSLELVGTDIGEGSCETECCGFYSPNTGWNYTGLDSWISSFAEDGSIIWGESQASSGKCDKAKS